MTETGAILGTPAYMAPEQARGEEVDPRADLFSPGGVLYRMAAGQEPFRGKDSVSRLLAVLSQQPSPLRQLNAQVPRELADLVMRLLEKDAAGRPASAAEVAEALRALERRGPGSLRRLRGTEIPRTGGHANRRCRPGASPRLQAA